MKTLYSTILTVFTVSTAALGQVALPDSSSLLPATNQPGGLAGNGTNQTPSFLLGRLVPTLSAAQLAAAFAPTAFTNIALGLLQGSVAPNLNSGIRPVPGGAVADSGLLGFQFAQNAGAAPLVSVSAPDGTKLAFRPAFLVLADRRTGQNYLLAEVTNAVGEIASPIEVIYRGAFDTIDADLLYRVDRNGSSVEQFVVLRASPALPPEFAPEDVSLECWTEWFEGTPTAIESPGIVLRPEGAGLPQVQSSDLAAQFGLVKLLPSGKAFSLDNDTNTAPVGKAWADIEQPAASDGTVPPARHFLIESVDWLTIRSKLATLPKMQEHSSLEGPKQGRKGLLASARSVPAQQASARPMLTVRTLVPEKPGVVIDFALGVPVPVPPGVISWWKAEGGGTDAMGLNNGTVLSSVSFVDAGKVNKAFSFNATSSSEVQVPNSASLNPTTAVTMEGWISVPAYPANDITIAGKDGVYSGRQYMLGLGYVNGQWVFRPHIGTSGGFCFFNGTVPVSLNTWYHVAMTYDCGRLALYVNGVLDQAATVTGPPTSSTVSLLIGGSVPGPWNFNGQIDELSLYNRALSASEIQAIYNAGSAGKGITTSCLSPPANIAGWWSGDCSASDLVNGHSAVPYNHTTYADAAVDKAFSFDGVDDYAKVPAVSDLDIGAANGMTVEAWIYPQDSTTGLFWNGPVVPSAAATSGPITQAPAHCTSTCQAPPGSTTPSPSPAWPITPITMSPSLTTKPQETFRSLSMASRREPRITAPSGRRPPSTSALAPAQPACPSVAASSKAPSTNSAFTTARCL